MTTELHVTMAMLPAADADQTPSWRRQRGEDDTEASGPSE